MRIRHDAGLLVLAIVVVGLLIRLGISPRQSLWADEIFTVAMATGHSLEHPADLARPELGDFVQGDAAMPAGTWARRYLAFDGAGIPARRIVRAVELSDTSPPLYYLAIAPWLAIAGIRDSTVHAFSVLWWLLAVPLVWSLGAAAGGSRGARFAVVLYALAPISVYYGTEGRMYSMAWCLAALLAWLTLRIHAGGGAGWLAAWTLTAAAGLLTHYFFAFPLAAAGVWLLAEPGRASRLAIVAAGIVALALVAPWYMRVPSSLAAWRVTGGWLAGAPGLPTLALNAVTLALAAFSVPGIAHSWGPLGPASVALAGVLVAVAAARRRLPEWTPAARLLLLTVAAAALGPVVFDLLRDSFASSMSRYALAAMPAALALFGALLARQRPAVAAVGVTLLLLVWAEPLVRFVSGDSRAGEPFERTAGAANGVGPDGLVLVHGIPSSVLGIAHYLDEDVPVAAWVGQLGQRRVPDDVARLTEGRDSVALVVIHAVGEPAPEEGWLALRRELLRTHNVQDARVSYYGPDGSTRR